MESYLRRPLYLLLWCAAVILGCGSNSAAQEPDLENLANRLSHQIGKARINSVVVAEFVSKEGETSPQGHYLASELSQSLDKHKKRFVVVERSQLTEALSHVQLLPKDLIAADSLHRVGNSLQVDAVVTGTLETTPFQYAVKVTLRSVKDGGLLGSDDELVKRPAIADGMALLASKVLPEQLSVAGQDGVGIPTCIYCPPPLYTDEARKAKLQGNVILVAIITLEGRAGKVTVTKAPDASLAKQASESMTKWRFRPATDKKGKPVSVLVPIEVTFRLY